MQLNRSIILTLFFLLITISNSYAQISLTERENLRKLMYKTQRIDSLPDSTAIYTCHIYITILKTNNYKPIIESSDTSFTKKIHDLHLLEEYNFKSIIGKRKAIRLVMPILFVTIGLKDRLHPTVKTDLLARKIDNLFFKPTIGDNNLQTEYLEPFILTIENFQYN